MNDLEEWIAKSAPNPSVFNEFYVKSSSCHSLAHFLSTSLPTSSSKRGPRLSVFYDFYVKSSSLYCLVHILSTSSSKSGPTPSVFLTILCDQLLDDDVFDIWNRALCTVSRAFCRPHCRPHLQKGVRGCQFFMIFHVKSSSLYSLVHILSTSSSKSGPRLPVFMIFVWNRALCTVSCTFCRPLSGSRRATVETETLERRPWTATLPEKTQGFVPETVFSREFTRSRSLTLPNYSQMLWLTWWCGWHDDWDGDVVAMMVRQLATDNRP